MSLLLCALLLSTVIPVFGIVEARAAGENITYSNVRLLYDDSITPPPPPPPEPVFTWDEYAPPVPGQDFVYDFEQSKMSWWKDWGGAFDTSDGKAPVEYSTDLKRDGNGGSLKVNVNYTGGSWEEANIAVWLQNQENTTFDLSGYN